MIVHMPLAGLICRTQYLVYIDVLILLLYLLLIPCIALLPVDPAERSCTSGSSVQKNSRDKNK